VGLTLALLLLCAAPQAQVQLYFQNTLADAAYQQQVFNRVAKRWVMPAAKDAPKPGEKTVVQVLIDGEGKILSAVVSMQSGSTKWDEAALAAVKRGAPFPRLPKSLGASSLEFHVHVTRS
jgi:protein TonB